MDIFIPYLFLLLLLPFSLYLILFFHREASASRNQPPGSQGWPILGENVKLAWSGMSKFVSERMERYSPDAFQTSLLGETVVVCCGAQGNKLVFTGDSKQLFNQWLPLSLKKVLLPDFENKTYKEMSGTFESYLDVTLKPEALRRYVPVMEAMARQHLHRHWSPHAAVKGSPLLHRYTFELSCKLFMGVVDEERMKRIWELFVTMRSGMITVPFNLPGTAFSRAIKAGKRIRWELARIVEARRKEIATAGPPEVKDLLTKLLLKDDENGTYSSDEHIGNYFVGIMVASYDATATALVAVVYHLAQYPHVYQGVFEEQMAIAKSKREGEILNLEDVEKMKYSWNVIRETMRLTPPPPGTLREATTDISFAGFTIYKGTKVLWTPHSSHKNPEYFPEPEKFDPSRFEGRGPPSYTFVPFGGGPRMCPGRSYAKLAILVFMHNLVKNFKFEKAILDEKLVVEVTTPKPTHGLHLRLYPHSS